MKEQIVLLGAETPGGRVLARKLRAEYCACKLAISGTSAQSIACMDVAGVVVAGEESEGASAPDPALLTLGIPLLALGSSARSLLSSLGRASQIHTMTEMVVPIHYHDDKLFAGVETAERWIGSAAYYEMPPQYQPVAEGEGVPLAFADREKDIYLLQFQIERNDPDGTRILAAFARDICHCTPWFTPEAMLDIARQEILDAVGEKTAVCSMSGGLDSTVAAVLARQAVGNRLKCVFVDTGLLRLGEAERAAQFFEKDLGLDFTKADASESIMRALAGIQGIQGKRRIVQREIVEALRDVAGGLEEGAVFIKGTTYVDIINECDDEAEESPVRVVEPLGDFFKDEIRMLGEMLGLPKEVLTRQPFPGTGLAARIRGEVTSERIRILRHADALFVEAVYEAGFDRRLDRFFALYLESQGSQIIVLRALQGREPGMNAARLPYDLLERTIERIQIEIPSVQRVLYDMTPGMAEWS